MAVASTNSVKALKAYILTVDVVGVFAQNVLVESLGAVVFMCHLTQSRQVVADSH